MQTSKARTRKLGKEILLMRILDWDGRWIRNSRREHNFKAGGADEIAIRRRGMV
jgi:hypothetical protein